MGTRKTSKLTEKAPDICFCGKGSNFFQQHNVWIGYNEHEAIPLYPYAAYSEIQAQQVDFERRVKEKEMDEFGTSLTNPGPIPIQIETKGVPEQRTRLCAVCRAAHTLHLRKLSPTTSVWTFRFYDDVIGRELFCVLADGRNAHRFWNTGIKYMQNMKFINDETNVGTSRVGLISSPTNTRLAHGSQHKALEHHVSGPSEERPFQGTNRSTNRSSSDVSIPATMPVALTEPTIREPDYDSRSVTAYFDPSGANDEVLAMPVDETYNNDQESDEDYEPPARHRKSDPLYTGHRLYVTERKLRNNHGQDNKRKQVPDSTSVERRKKIHTDIPDHEDNDDDSELTPADELWPQTLPSPRNQMLPPARPSRAVPKISKGKQLASPLSADIPAGSSKSVNRNRVSANQTNITGQADSSISTFLRERGRRTSAPSVEPEDALQEDHHTGDLPGSPLPHASPASLEIGGASNDTGGANISAADESFHHVIFPRMNVRLQIRSEPNWVTTISVEGSETVTSIMEKVTSFTSPFSNGTVVLEILFQDDHSIVVNKNSSDLILHHLWERLKGLSRGELAANVYV